MGEHRAHHITFGEAQPELSPAQLEAVERGAPQAEVEALPAAETAQVLNPTEDSTV